MLRSLLPLVSAVGLVLSLVACADDESSPEKVGGSEAAQTAAKENNDDESCEAKCDPGDRFVASSEELLECGSTLDCYLVGCGLGSKFCVRK